MSAIAVTPELLRTLPLPHHRSGDDKEDRGRVLVVAGSAEMPGAAILAGEAALRVGAGKVQLAVCDSVAGAVGAAFPEARVFRMAETAAGGIAPEEGEGLVRRARRAAAVLVGPGMLDDPAVDAIVGALLSDAEGPPLLLDAAALKGLRRHADSLGARGGRVVLTPHMGEMASCLDMDVDAVAAQPLETAQRASAALKGVVVLKGGCTRIAAPDGRAWSCDRGDVGLATSGSGDTLAGMIAGLMARGAEAALAAVWGVFIHGEAGDRLARKQGRLGFLARELAGEAPGILGDYSR